MPKSPQPLAIALPVPGPLGVLLNAGPLRAALHFTRADGAPLTPRDVADAQASLDAWARSEARRQPALPSPAILEAVARGGGLRPGSSAAEAAAAAVEAAPARGAKRAPKPTARPRKAAKRPA